MIGLLRLEAGTMATTLLPGLRATNYKCFGADPTGFDEILPLNIVVGRNNSGKSALLDIVDLACNYRHIAPFLYSGTAKPELLVEATLGEAALKSTFSPSSSGGGINGNHWAFGKQFIGKKATFALGDGPSLTFKTIEGAKASRDLFPYFNRIQKTEINPLEGRLFRRLLADRDVAPETDSDDTVIRPNGSGFTNVVQRLLNKALLPSKLIDEEMLGDLNAIFGPDSKFTGIVTQQHDNGMWEIFLRETHKGLISLSHSGSGLKTVLLVVGFFICLPFTLKTQLSQFVFAFEELENNLHPALQRRLINYIRQKCLQHGCIAFITTHSSAVIDFTSHSSTTQILHVFHDGAVARVRRVVAYVDNRGVLDDLDVRASDLLQANGIVWVEGPSDRLYFNRWISLLTNGALAEGLHYQCVFYGGRLLAHLSGAAPFDADLQEQAVKILAVNRNAILLVDSDKSSAGAELNETKRRMIAEIERTGGMVWVTQGREVENYIAPAVIERIYPGTNSVAQYSDIVDVLEKGEKGRGRRFAREKVLFAERAAECTKKDDLLGILDLSARLTEVSHRIGAWNGIPPTW